MFNNQHLFKIYSLTDTLMHRTWNFRELGSTVCLNSQLGSLQWQWDLKTRTSAQGRDTRFPKMSTLLPAEHWCSALEAPSPDRRLSPVVALTRFQPISTFNRMEELKQRKLYVYFPPNPSFWHTLFLCQNESFIFTGLHKKSRAALEQFLAMAAVEPVSNISLSYPRQMFKSFTHWIDLMQPPALCCLLSESWVEYLKHREMISLWHGVELGKGRVPITVYP